MHQPIRRTAAQRSRAKRVAAAAAKMRWTVFAWRDGACEVCGSYSCPNEARAEARRLYRAEHIRTWVRAA